LKTKLTLVAIALLSLLGAFQVQAQATANYAFATNVNGTFTNMSSGTTQLVAAGADDTASLLTNIGFEFVFMGTRYLQFSVSSNGYLRLGGAVSTTQYALATGTIPLITAMGSDLITSTSGKVHYKVTGSAPTRVLTVEWLNETIIYDGSGTIPDGTYQLRLYETTGVIETVYGAMNRNTSTGFSAAMNPQYVGFSTSTTAFATVDFGTNTANTTVTAFANQATLGAPIPNLNTPTDGSRRVYSFTPVLPNPPTGLTFTGVGPLVMTLNWTDSSNELSYLIYRSTDGTNFTFDGTAAGNATSYPATGLVPNTTYFWNVYAITEGGVSTPLSGSQATTAGGNVSSTAAGGLWSSTATWVGGVLPASTDNVTIVNGATVTIDTAAVALTVTIGTGGAASLLQWETAVARTLAVGSNVTVGSNGTFQTGAAGPILTHALSVGGNLTNNGVLDFSTAPANAAAATITFTGGTSNTFSGSGATTDIRSITMNKGVQSAVLEINTTNFTVQGVATDVAAWCTLTSGTLKLSGTFAGTNRIFTAAAYSIPAAGGFWLNNPNYIVAGQNGSPTVTGLLRVSQGTLNIGIATGNSMGFATNSTIIVEGGTINATGKFGVSAAANVITYTQSAGTITVCTIGNATSNVASFDVGTSASSTVNISGGAIIVPLASTAVTPIDYRMQSGGGPVSVTGGTLQLGTAASGAAKTFNLRGILPTTTVTNTSANHNATMGTIATYNHAAMGSVTFSGTFNAGTSFFLFFGPAFTNNGTLTHNGAGSRFFFTANTAQTYAGTGIVNVALTSVELDTPGGLSVTSTNQLITNRFNLFTGSIVNSNKITLGSGAATTGIVQIGNGGPPASAAGTFDVPLTFNLGTGGQNVFYASTTTSRTTGNEINPTRILTNLSADDAADPTHVLTIAGGDLTVNGTLTLANERVATGTNTLIMGAAGVVTRTAGHVDGNFRKPIAAAGPVTFEVGTANGYSPVNFNVTGGTFPTTATIAAVQSAAPGIQPAGKVLQRYWKLNASGITTDVTFNYLDPPDVPGTVTEANLRVFRHGVANPSDYSDQGGTINTAANTATVTGVSSFSDWTLAEAGADLAITKTDGVTTATPGGSVTYTITASNNGPGANPTSTVADTFPAGLTCSTTCVGAGGGVCTSGPFAGNINDAASIPSGGSVTYTSTCSVSPSLTGSIANTATVNGGAIADSFGANNSATDTDVLAADADLAITKTDGVTTVTAGGSTTYTITASNAGPSASGATVADTFPASLTCTWTCAGLAGGTCTGAGAGNINDSVNLPAGGSVTYTASCTISGAASGSLSNTATVTTTGGVTDPTPGNNSATDTDTIGASADLSITKTDGVTTATPGGSVTYTITASNPGPSNATGATVADTFPASLTCTWTCAGLAGGTCTAAGSGNLNDSVNLPSGGSVTYTASCTISGAATGTLSNTATVTAPGGVTDPTPGNNSATDSDTLGASADLSITKTDGVTTATPGGSVTYTITASNAGPSNATSSTVADTFPASLTCTWTCAGLAGGTCTAAGSGNLNDSVNLPSGASVTYTASCTISGAATGTLSNTATVTAPGGVTDPTPGNNSATDSDTLGANADLAITKTDGTTTATAGGSTTYTITASNAGPSNATGATVADTFPASLTCTWTCLGAGGGTCTAGGAGNINDSVNLPSGGSVTYTASCTISGAATGSLTNTATVAAPGGVTDPTPGNNSATDIDALGASADLAITKTDGTTTATAGGSTTYTITASNAGPSTATAATVADTFPASLTCTWTCAGLAGGTCTAAGAGNINDSVNLPSGGSVTYTASCTISGAATGSLTNTATVTAPGSVTDPTPGNNSATDVDALGASADLSITKTDGVTAATAGGSVTYTITASNAGPSPATAATVADTFPASLTCTWTCAGLAGGTCTAAGAGNINDSVNLPSGGSVTYTASCTISGAATGTLSNTATVTAPGSVTDPTPGNNSATDSDTLGATANLAITKTDGVTTATPGASVTYTITASNAGPSTATGATVADTFPASLTCTWSCAGLAGGTCTAGGAGNINDTVNLPSGGSVTYTASCTISGTATGTLSNTATVAAPGGVTDPTPANNSATDSDTLAVSADLSVTKTDGTTTVTAGGSTTYTITASNAGPSTATAATVADTFPASLTCTWTCAGLAGGTCTAAGAGNINDSATLPSGGSVTYTASCTISGAATGTVSNTATVTAPAGVTDPTPGNNSATDSDTIPASAGAMVSGTKTAAGSFTVGSNVTYTITLTNNGTAAQANNPGNEFTDTLPPQLALVTATSTSGAAVANVGTNTVTWNGGIAAAGSVTITITATILPAAVGSTVTNQGTISYDSDGNGTNDATAVTDDPAAGGSANATGFVIAPAVSGEAIPALDPLALLLLTVLMAAIAFAMLKRQ
jgi:uncharacterized repeat protein (TIGR01451 family)